VRFSAFTPWPGGDIRSIVTSDGTTFGEEDGIRFAVAESAGMEKEFVRDVADVRLPGGA
jgi:hypothetical protein